MLQDARGRNWLHVSDEMRRAMQSQRKDQADAGVEFHVRQQGYHD